MKTRQPFTGTGEYVARKMFVYDGKSFRPGDVFPWSGLKVSQRRLRQMYEAGMLNGAGEAKPARKTTKRR